jgi:8-oxo-dGTP diphosphatase
MGVGRFMGVIEAVIRHDNTYLLLQRSPKKDVGAGAWECVTGRVDQGESYEEALRREVREELGVEIEVEFIIATDHFYRGEAIAENEALGVQFCCCVADPARVTTGEEHSAFRWLAPEQIAEFLPATHWLLIAIQRAEKIRAVLSPELQHVYRDIFN